MSFVLDVSLSCKWFFADEATPDADRILERLVGGEAAVVPALFRWEFASALMSAERAGRIEPDETENAFEVVRDLPIFVDDPGRKIFRALEFDLARAFAITVYDAAYLAVAANRRLDLATADAGLATVARDLGIDVDFVP